MSLNLKESLYCKYLNSSIREEITEKIYKAEQSISILRLIVVLFNSGTYLFFLNKTYCIDWIAIPIIVSSILYSLFVLLFKPYRQNHLYLSSAFTTITDCSLIILWIYATGGYHSPFYLVWYICVLAIAFRYNMALTLKLSALYGLTYFLILYNDENFDTHKGEILIRIGYLMFFSCVGALMSQEILDQIGDKFLVKKSQEETRLREAELRETRDQLEERVILRTLELHDSNKQLQLINEDIDNFVYSASHDLKSPLNNLEALLTMLYEDRPPQNDYEETVKEKLYSSIKRMNKTIHKLADVAKSQKEIYDDIGHYHVQDILQEVLDENAEIIRGLNVRFEMDFAEAAEVYFSRICLKSILYNLVTNSIKYRSPNRQPIIQIRMQQKLDSAQLSFKDNGLGIDLGKNGNKLFTLFKRFHDHVEGTGIGLYMVKRMIEKFEGTIELQSEVDKGCTFTIEFKHLGRASMTLNSNPLSKANYSA